MYMKAQITLLNNGISGSEYTSCILQAASSTYSTAICAFQQNCVLPLKFIEKEC